MTFSLLVRLSDQPGQPVHTIPVRDDTDYHEVRGNVVASTKPEQPDQLSVALKCELSPGWWLRITNTAELQTVLTMSRSQGQEFALVSASVYDKSRGEDGVFLEEPSVAAFPPANVALSVAASKPKAKGKTKTPVKRKTTTAKKQSSTTPRGDKKDLETTILSSIFELASLGIEWVPLSYVGLFSGYKNVQSLSFKTAVKSLVDGKGFVESQNSKSGKLVRLTSAGTAAAGTVATPPKSNAEVQERLKQFVKDPKAGQIFDELANGRAHNKKTLAATVGYSNDQSAGFKNPIKTMRLLGIVEEVKDPNHGAIKLLQLTDIAFPFGRPGSSASPLGVGPNITDEEMSM